LTEVKRISYEAWRIVTDERSNKIERIEALKLIAACKGLLLPDINEQWLSVRQVAQLRRIKQELVEKALQRRERKRKANRRGYLRRQLKALRAPAVKTVEQNA
jgi:hypothetical protein